MDFGSAISVLLRRWLVVLVGLVLTVGAGAYLYISIPPSYQAIARVLLLLPSTSQSRGDEVLVGSPYLYLPDGLNILARVVVSTPGSFEFEEEMVARGLTSEFEVGVDPRVPIISVSVEGRDPDNVIATRDELLDVIKSELLQVQQEALTPPRQFAHPKVYATSDTPEEMSGSRLRGALATIAAGGLATLLAAFAIDRLIQRRRARRACSSPEPGESNNGAPSPAEEGGPAPDKPDPGEGHAPKKPDEDPSIAPVTADAGTHRRTQRRRPRRRLTRRVPDEVRRRRARYVAYLPDSPGDSSSQ